MLLYLYLLVPIYQARTCHHNLRSFCKKKKTKTNFPPHSVTFHMMDTLSYQGSVESLHGKNRQLGSKSPKDCSKSHKVASSPAYIPHANIVCIVGCKSRSVMHSETTCQYLIERGGTQEKFESISYIKLITCNAIAHQRGRQENIERHIEGEQYHTIESKWKAKS